jgi:hypothetical protein
LKLDHHLFSGLVMVRVPLVKSDTYPFGRVQPYFGVGPAAFVSEATADLPPVGVEGPDFKDTSTDVGLHAVLGIKFLWALPDLPGKALGIFLEEGFTHYNPSAFKDDIAGMPLEIDFDDLNIWHGTIGLTLHF